MVDIKNIEDRNLSALLTETINQFNYSSNLFDSLESRSNTIIVSISIILAVVLDSYFLKKLENFSLIINLFYYIGVGFVIFSLILALNLRRRKFKKIKIEELKEKFQKNPEKDFSKVIIGKYVPVIQENIKHYHEKDRELIHALDIMKIGSTIVMLIILYIFIITNIP